MDLVSSFVMLITSKLAARPSVYKYLLVFKLQHRRPKLLLIMSQGRRRIETIGIILFCALMTTVSIQLMIDPGRPLGGGPPEAQQLHIIPLVFVEIASKETVEVLKIERS